MSQICFKPTGRILLNPHHSEAIPTFLIGAGTFKYLAHSGGYLEFGLGFEKMPTEKKLLPNTKLPFSEKKGISDPGFEGILVAKTKIKPPSTNKLKGWILEFSFPSTNLAGHGHHDDGHHDNPGPNFHPPDHNKDEKGNPLKFETQDPKKEFNAANVPANDVNVVKSQREVDEEKNKLDTDKLVLAEREGSDDDSPDKVVVAAQMEKPEVAAQMEKPDNEFGNDKEVPVVKDHKEVAAVHGKSFTDRYGLRVPALIGYGWCSHDGFGLEESTTTPVPSTPAASDGETKGFKRKARYAHLKH